MERLDIEQVVFHTGQLRIEMEIVCSDKRVEIQLSPRYSNSSHKPFALLIGTVEQLVVQRLLLTRRAGSEWFREKC